MASKKSHTDIQKSAEQRFKTSRWPSPSREEWRRTDLSKFGIEEYSDNKAPRMIKNLSAVIRETTEFDLAVTVDAGGKAQAVFSSKAAAAGVTLALAGKKTDTAFRNIIQWSYDRMNEKTGYWNFTAADSSLLLSIPEGIHLSRPVIFKYILEERPETSRTVLLNLFVNAGEKSEAEIIQHFTASGKNLCISSMSTIHAGRNSRIKTAVISEISESSLFLAHRNIKLYSGSIFLDFQNYNGSKLTKSRTETILEEENITAELLGTVFAVENEHFDIRTIQKHQSSNGKSQALLKSVVRDRGRTIFQGLIDVAENGPLTDAFLTNNNIILNDGARADSIPSLKIRNNNVKCSHGSTTGKIDQKQLFYLTSRGLVPEKARGLILEGFLNEVYDKLPESFVKTSLSLMEKNCAMVSKRTA